MSDFKDKRYLGDSVYVQHDGYHIVLTTENGGGASNMIFLEPHLVDLVQAYLNEMRGGEKNDQN